MRLNLLSRVENAHDDSIWAASWAPGSNALATGSVDESVKVWQEAGDTLEQKHHLVGLSLGVVSVAVDSSGSYGAASSLDSYVSVWSQADYSLVHQFKDIPPSETWALTFAPRGPEAANDRVTLAVAGGSSNTVRLLDAVGGTTLANLTVPPPPGDTAGQAAKRERFVLSVAYSPDGRRLAAGSMDGSVAVFDTATGGLLHSLPGHFRPVRGLTFTPDSKMLLTACDDTHAHLYDVEQMALVEAFTGHESWVLSVSCHPDGTAFATGGSDGKVKLWDLQTRTGVQTVSEHTDQVWGVAFRPDGSRLASVSDDKSICLYDFS